MSYRFDKVISVILCSLIFFWKSLGRPDFEAYSAWVRALTKDCVSFLLQKNLLVMLYNCPHAITPPDFRAAEKCASIILLNNYIKNLILLTLELLANTVRYNFVPVDFCSHDWQLPAQRLESRVGHCLIILGYCGLIIVLRFLDNTYQLLSRLLLCWYC